MEEEKKEEDLFTRWTKAKWLFWLIKNKKQIGWSAACFCCLLFIGMRIFSFFHTQSVDEFSSITRNFSQWDKSPHNEEAYQKLRSSLARGRTVFPLYEGKMAQKLIEEKQVSLAFSLGEKIIGRIDKESPFYASYSKTSLCIEREEFALAITEAISLKEKMNKTPIFLEKGGDLLYAYNLLRIAFLTKKREDKAGELLAWEELESYLQDEKNKTINTQNKQAFLAAFRQDNIIELTDYIFYRKNLLK